MLPGDPVSPPRTTWKLVSNGIRKKSPARPHSSCLPSININLIGRAGCMERDHLTRRLSAQNDLHNSHGRELPISPWVRSSSTNDQIRGEEGSPAIRRSCDVPGRRAEKRTAYWRCRKCAEGKYRGGRGTNQSTDSRVVDEGAGSRSLLHVRAGDGELRLCAFVLVHLLTS